MSKIVGTYRLKAQRVIVGYDCRSHGLFKRILHNGFGYTAAFMSVRTFSRQHFCPMMHRIDRLGAPAIVCSSHYDVIDDVIAFAVSSRLTSTGRGG